MPFEVMPVLKTMMELYRKPRDFSRFQAYLQLLTEGTKADLVVPVQHYNPMAREDLVEKLRELHRLGAEAAAAAACAELNATSPDWPDEPVMKVALNLADDLRGGWTNRYTTDFANKFGLGPLLKRGFCTPILWASEAYSPALVRRRTLAQGWRVRYRLRHAAPRTVADHLAQEQFVAGQLLPLTGPLTGDYQRLLARYEEVQQAIDPPTLLTFFYGDEAARQLGHREWGNWPAGAGFRLAWALASQRG